MGTSICFALLGVAAGVTVCKPQILSQASPAAIVLVPPVAVWSVLGVSIAIAKRS